MFDRCFFFLIALLVGASIIPFHINPDNFIADDAYFYLQVAHNIAQGKGSTFHQITSTNGYHPLWMACCVIGALITPGNKIALLHLMAIIQFVFYGISLFFLYRITLKLGLRFFSIGICLLTFLLLNVGGLRIFEAHLSIMLHLIALDFFLTLYNGKKNSSFLFSYGLILGAVLLSRIDTIFFVVPLWLASAYLLIAKEQSKIPLFQLMTVTVSPLLLGIGYLGVNYYAFGHFVPISGVLKSSFPEAHFSWLSLGLHGLIGLIPTIAGLILILLTSYKRDKKAILLYSLLLVGIVSHALYIATFSWGSQWYYVTAYAAAPLCFMQLFTDLHDFLRERLEILAKSLAIAVQICVLLLLSSSVLISYLKAHYHFSVVLVATGKQRFDEKVVNSQARVVGGLLEKYIDPNSAIFVFDSPGILAYYSERKIVPVDGLMNNFAYNDEIVKEGIATYLAKRNIHFFLGPITESGYHAPLLTIHPHKEYSEVMVAAPLSKKSAGCFRIYEEDIAFITDNPVRPMDETIPEIAVWKIRL